MNMAGQNPLSGFVKEQQPDNLDIESRAQLAARARVSSKDKDIYRRHQQQSVATSLVPVKDQSQSIVAVTNTVSKPRVKAVKSPTTTTRSTVRSPSHRVQKLIRTDQKDISHYDGETQLADLSQDDTFHSDFLDSPSPSMGPVEAGMPTGATQSNEEDEYQPETPTNERVLFNTWVRQAAGDHVDDGESQEEIDEEEEVRSSDEEIYEDEDEELVTKVFTPAITQAKHQQTTVQRPQERIPPHTAPVKISNQSSQMRLNPFGTKLSNKVLSGNSVSRSGYQDHRVHFLQGSPSRSKTPVVPIYETGTPSRGKSVTSKRIRPEISNDKIQIQPFSAGTIHNAHLTSETKTTSKAEELRAMDYSAEILAKKKFAELETEPFDHDPQRIKGELEQHFGSDGSFANMDLADQLHRVYDIDDVEVQSMFFDSLELEEWEEAGDWFIDQFTDLMKRSKEARRTKREISGKFEAEITKRHDAVEGRIGGTMKTMEDMKKSGQVVLKTNSVALGSKDES